ncbi:hypothetical protein [Paraburkholderia sp. J8-2]|uniref:hypothetical protein n=1 Tax=Paraburkholderia sp. J8-2 TaxID=2805440 RepID=UPI002AB60751|nr:hypothetical protein [Paraburkholderia sp. J8-2]
MKKKAIIVDEFHEGASAQAYRDGVQQLRDAVSDIHTKNDGIAPILIARVTVGDETLVVKADEITAALTALHGEPKAGMRLEAVIEFDAMTPAEFASIPEYQ